MFTNLINWFKKLFGCKVAEQQVVEEQHMNMSGPRDKTKKVHNGPPTHHYGHGSTNNNKVR